MNEKDLHERVSEILAQVMDLPSEEALQKIDFICKDDPELKKEVLDLYDVMNQEEEPSESLKLSESCILISGTERERSKGGGSQGSSVERHEPESSADRSITLGRLRMASV